MLFYIIVEFLFYEGYVVNRNSSFISAKMFILSMILQGYYAIIIYIIYMYVCVGENLWNNCYEIYPPN